MSFEEMLAAHRRWIAVDIAFGACATFAAFEYHRFTLLFLTGASIWFLVLFSLYAHWWKTRDHFVVGRKKAYRGMGLLSGFLIALLVYYLIVWLDPALR